MTTTADLFRPRLKEMIDHKNPGVVLSKRLPWAAIEQALAPHLARKTHPGSKLLTKDWLGEYEVQFGSRISAACRLRLSIRLMISLKYLKNSFNLSDEEFDWAEAKNILKDFGDVYPIRRKKEAALLEKIK